MPSDPLDLKPLRDQVQKSAIPRPEDKTQSLEHFRKFVISVESRVMV